MPFIGLHVPSQQEDFQGLFQEDAEEDEHQAALKHNRRHLLFC